MPRLPLSLVEISNAARNASKKGRELHVNVAAELAKLKGEVSSIKGDISAAKDNVKKRSQRRWEEGSCFISALIASEKLALAALQIEESVYKCAPAKTQAGGPSAQASCAADISGVYASFSAAGSYLSAVAQSCPTAVQTKKAACAADMLDIQYGLGTLASAMSNIGGACSIGSLVHSKPIPRNRRASAMGMCVVNAAQAAAYIGHAVISIQASTQDCNNKGVPEAACAAQISGVLQSFLLIAAYLSNAAALCGDTAVAGAACSNHVTSIAAGFMEISAGGTASAVDCSLFPANHSHRPR